METVIVRDGIDHRGCVRSKVKPLDALESCPWCSGRVPIGEHLAHDQHTHPDRPPCITYHARTYTAAEREAYGPAGRND